MIEMRPLFLQRFIRRRASPEYPNGRFNRGDFDFWKASLLFRGGGWGGAVPFIPLDRRTIFDGDEIRAVDVVFIFDRKAGHQLARISDPVFVSRTRAK
jgi:hypothetical protein